MNVQLSIGGALCGIALGVALNELRHSKQEKQELIKEVECYKRFIEFEALLRNQCKSLEMVLNECEIIRNYRADFQVDYKCDIIEDVQAIEHNLNYCYTGSKEL